MAEQANSATAELPPANRPTPRPAGGPPPGAKPGTEPLVATASIPQALQGRWGLTPADCMSGRGDTKGLLVASRTELRFYESRAVPAADIDTDPDSISGNFAFTGEGKNWTRYQSLQLDDRKLVRTETNPNMSFTYARC